MYKLMFLIKLGKLSAIISLSIFSTSFPSSPLMFSNFVYVGTVNGVLHFSEALRHFPSFFFLSVLQKA